jgi:hypothetical protein
MYCRSLNEILDLFGCIISAVWFEFQIQTHFLFLNQLVLMLVLELQFLHTNVPN